MSRRPKRLWVRRHLNQGFVDLRVGFVDVECLHVINNVVIYKADDSFLAIYEVSLYVLLLGGEYLFYVFDGRPFCLKFCVDNNNVFAIWYHSMFSSYVSLAVIKLNICTLHERKLSKIALVVNQHVFVLFGQMVFDQKQFFKMVLEQAHFILFELGCVLIGHHKLVLFSHYIIQHIFQIVITNGLEPIDVELFLCVEIF